MAEQKPVKCIVLDAGPLILNDPSISSLLAKSDELYSTPAVIAEIRDPAARSRLETTVQPFLKLRDPAPASLKVVSDFARRTGDLAVLSRTDLQILALAYELECERNGGDWRLRRTPGQKTLNGPPPTKESTTQKDAEAGVEAPASESNEANGTVKEAAAHEDKADVEEEANGDSLDDVANTVENLTLSEDTADTTASNPTTEVPQVEDDQEEDDSGGEWITLSNLASKKARDEAGPGGEDLSSDQAVMEVATITTDYAMQNVLLQMNLNLLSPSIRRVKQIKSHILRCHACFATTKEMNRQFCQRCGKPTLTRVACSTKSNGTFVLHLKKSFQYNKRGERYSIPKPVAGSANGRVDGGGKGGWGNELMLAEDQKEYTRAVRGHAKSKQKSLMDEDYLPGILTGDRGGTGGSRPKVGAGRNVNSRKR